MCTHHIAKANRGACQSRTLFTDIGFMEPGPALDRLALAEIDKGPNSFATDAALYLRKHGAPAVKPLVYERLAKWHQKFIDGGAEKRFKDRKDTTEDMALSNLIGGLVDTFTRAQGWLLSPSEDDDLQALLGTEKMGQLACAFHCGGSLWTNNGAPSYYWIYGRMNQNFEPPLSSMEYLKPVERLYYSINQYRCDDMKALKEKISQFPKGSLFGFTYDFSAADKDEVLEIITFLRDHGYKVVGPHTWSFWPADSAR